MGEDLIWVTRHGRFRAAGANPWCEAWATALRVSGLDVPGFAEHVSAILPHRAVTEAHVRAWVRGPTPPPGDILWAGLRLAGVDILAVLEAVEPVAREIAVSSAAAFERSVEGLAGLQLDKERLIAAQEVHCKPDGRVLTDLSALTRQYGRLNDTIAPRTLLPAVTGHHQRLLRLLMDAPPPEYRRQLSAILGEAAMLCGWLAFLLEDGRGARSYWALAHELGGEYADEALEAQVLIARSLLCSSMPHGGRGGDPRLALELLDRAEALSRGKPALLAWSRSRRAEEHAAAGHERACAEDLAVAERAIEQIGNDSSPLPGPRSQLDLAGFRGNCFVLLGRDHDAAEVLQSAVQIAPAERGTFRSVLFNDLGTALARLGEVDAACAAFERAVDLATETGATVHVQRVAGAAQYLGRWCDCAPVRQLRERLQLLA